MHTHTLPASCQQALPVAAPLRGAFTRLWEALSAFGKRLLPAGYTFYDPKEQRIFDAARHYETARARCHHNI